MLRILICALLAAVPLCSFAQDDPMPGLNPLWELGIGGGSVYAPDYPGSNHMNTWFIPFPFGVYRGEIVHSDRRGGTRARLLHRATWELNVSAGGGLPSSAHANGARDGMPDLEWVGEAGPRVMIDLWEDEPTGRLFRLGIPLRSALSTNGRHLTDRGFIFSPELMYDNPRIFGTRADAFAHITMDFLDRRYANYFYGVTPRYETAERPAYVARGGYLRTELSLGLMLPFKETRLRVFTFGSLSTLDGSSNRASPLFKSAYNADISVVLLWVFAKSEIQVHSAD
jgi:outer membrane protein